jgi:RNA polymerase sigma-70 factor (ECF subfamily)
VASNLLVDRGRLRARERAVEFDEAAVRHEPPPRDEGALRALANLSPRERALLWLAHVEGYSHDEIGRALGVARGSVRVLLFRARKRLRGVLEHG